jgi:hypothetical protein
LNIFTVIKNNGFFLVQLVRRFIILVLAGLLIFHHSIILYNLYIGAGDIYNLYGSSGGALAWFENLQSALRAVIVVSLLLVVFGVRPALWVMWAGISGLVATQYWAHFGDLPVAFTEGRHPLSYLRGFIFPTIITLMFPSSRSHIQQSNSPKSNSEPHSRTSD